MWVARAYMECAQVIEGAIPSCSYARNWLRDRGLDKPAMGVFRPVDMIRVLADETTQDTFRGYPGCIARSTAAGRWG